MLSWFSRKRPIDLADKAHIEFRFSWLAEQIGWDILRESETWTPLKFSWFDSGISEEDAQVFVDMVADSLPDNESKFQIVALPQRLMPGGEEEGIEFHYDFQSVDPVSTPTIKVSRNVMLDRCMTMAALVQFVVNDYAGRKHHDFLEYEDRDLILALFAVFHGLGIICANGTLKMTTETMEQTHVSRVRYVGAIPAQYFGYALALKSWLMGEEPGETQKLLRPDAGVMMKKAVKYLRSTGDACVTPGDLRDDTFGKRASACVDDLTSESAQIRLLALWTVEESEKLDDEKVMSAVVESFHHVEPDVAGAAKYLLTKTRVFPTQVVGCLQASLDERDDTFSSVAAKILAGQGLYTDHVVDYLRYLFRHRRRADAAVIMSELVMKQGMTPELESFIPEFIDAAGRLVAAGDQPGLFAALNPALSKLENLLDLIRVHSPSSTDVEVEQLVQIAYGQDPFEFDEPDFGEDRFVIR
ncbi:MAG: hypothetical protein AAF456_14995 [Planctomycetota bacterium]